ncbi:RraA family protein [Paracidobacterium acidisoli]|uniref:RraA family protein n=1 Tax=Paracidobacterium acidisoli TaxID=2303751 RepID=A0A372ILP2_9BACT|nr:RraA family protein [Paracidobacterium acidisoli]MBT9332403.1 RraA family protein [Paracidobacterium acidisoli]
MKRMIVAAVIASTFLGMHVHAQVRQTKEQIMFYTADWKGDRFPDGRPKVPDDLLTRALDVSIEDIWDFLRGHGYQNQFESDWHALHADKPTAGRALTAQYMPSRPDIAKAEAAEGKAEGRITWSNNNSWPIQELVQGDIYVADGYGKVVDGTLIGSNLGNGIAAHTHNGFVFYGGIRDEAENREIPSFNGFYKGYDPSAWAQEELTCINCPVRIGRAVVLPGDLVIANAQGVIFVPAILAEDAISSAEFTNLMDAYNFELNKEGKNGAQFEGGWNAQKFAGFKQWVYAHPEKLKMSRAEFDTMYTGRMERMTRHPEQ